MLTHTLDRSPETETAAALMRHTRRLYAQKLRETRHAAATGNPQARAYLEKARAFTFPLPNPDRRADCARAAESAAKYHENTTGTIYSKSAHAAAYSAEVFTLLQMTAKYLISG